MRTKQVLTREKLKARINNTISLDEIFKKRKKKS